MTLRTRSKPIFRSYEVTVHVLRLVTVLYIDVLVMWSYVVGCVPSWLGAGGSCDWAHVLQVSRVGYVP